MNVSDLARRAHVVWLSLRARFATAIPLPESTTVIIAPHPDDETIGCGGLIQRLVALGRPPHVVILTGGEGSHGDAGHLAAGEIRSARRALTRESAAALNLPESHIHELDYHDGGIGKADSHQTQRLRQLLESLAPGAVFVPHPGEGWPDHIAVESLVRPMLPHGCTLWHYCVWMWYYNVWRGLAWSEAHSLRLSPRERRLKQKSIDAYTLPLAPDGRPWSGDLPTLFLQAHRSPYELYFKTPTMQ